jgi:hypothetical protein
MLLQVFSPGTTKGARSRINFAPHSCKQASPRSLALPKEPEQLLDMKDKSYPITTNN